MPGRYEGEEIQILLPGPFADKRFVQLSAEADYERLIESGIELSKFTIDAAHEDHDG